MNLNEYQNEALRTSGDLDRVCGALGLSGEAGEVIASLLQLAASTGAVADTIKKIRFHGHSADRDKLINELGDVLWYVASTAATLNASLDEIAEANIKKLKDRYPDGFSTERSINRV